MLLPVEEALARVTAAFSPLPSEQVSVADATGRILAEDAVARVTQPPIAVSAMDGYAVRGGDVADAPVTLRVVGAAPAGAAWEGVVQPGEAVRIFTGGPVPDGADTIVIQENTDLGEAEVVVREAADTGNYVRPAGLDFTAGDVGIEAGSRLGAREVGLAAAMNLPWLAVRRRPRIALLATGDEVVRPGDPVGPSQIVSSNTLALASLIGGAGGVAIDLGIARDDEDSLRHMASGAAGADLLVTTGGVSVGEHDLVQKVLGAAGMKVDFWRIAMRPGKPLMFGRIGDTPVLGLPGNPVSALVCGLVFLAPALDALLGVRHRDTGPVTALLGDGLPGNDERQDYLRATLSRDEAGALVAMPFPRQDSSMLSTLVRADCLLVRPPHAPPAAAGTRVGIIRL